MVTANLPRALRDHSGGKKMMGVKWCLGIVFEMWFNDINTSLIPNTLDLYELESLLYSWRYGIGSNEEM